jgi:prepilin-type N-terminal cleavage/methylation domain-containing protein
MFKQISDTVKRVKFNYFNKHSLAPLNSTRSAPSNLAGFTLIELLVVISIIGFLTMTSVVVFNIVRMSARDAVRVGNIATMKRALAMYLNDSATGYPASTGECLKASSGVGAELKASKVLLAVPVDPLWPFTTPAQPSSVINGFAVSPSQNFCYYYFSNAMDQYKISFFLESNSKSGNAGINTTTQ